MSLEQLIYTVQKFDHVLPQNCLAVKNAISRNNIGEVFLYKSDILCYGMPVILVRE